MDPSRAEFERQSLGTIPAELGGIDGEFGREIALMVRAARDLCLDAGASCTFDVVLGPSYPIRPPVVTCRTAWGHLPAQLRGGGCVDAAGGVTLPVLSEAEQYGWSRSYTLAVLFYALRQLFAAGDGRPWEWAPPPPCAHAADQQGGAPAEVTLARAGSGAFDGAVAGAPKFAVVAAEASTMGRRRTMEDVTVLRPHAALRGAGDGSALFCIFDGHGGRGCAEWAGATVPDRCLDEARRRGDAREALFRAFVDADGDWEGRQPLARDASGATAIAALFDGDRGLYVANLGDCRCVLARRDRFGELKARDLSTDARADRPDEVARISAAHGFVANRRVNGGLAVSRALGDVGYKRRRAADDARTPVSCEPDVARVQLTADDAFFVLACDGLWDVLSSQEAVDFVQTELHLADDRDPGALEAVCARLARHAVDDKKSTDNVSVCVVRILAAAQARPAARDGKAAAAEQKENVFRRSPQATAQPRLGGSAAQRAAGLASRPAAGQPPSFGAPVAGRTATRDPSKESDDDILDFLLDDSNFS
ncbi:phosphatase 2C-like domain-containing protein [Pelagophyceae sp. CCMP2097]|nr:phosphatase 2C-like domain-containing protein [Pelagophyceae sp. CCMP2097]